MTELCLRNTGCKGLLSYTVVGKGVLREIQGSLEEAMLGNEGVSHHQTTGYVAIMGAKRQEAGQSWGLNIFIM